MGSYADERLTTRDAVALLGAEFADASDAVIQTVMDEAYELAERERMPFEAALKEVSGISRTPYGAPRQR